MTAEKLACTRAEPLAAEKAAEMGALMVELMVGCWAETMAAKLVAWRAVRWAD